MMESFTKMHATIIRQEKKENIVFIDNGPQKNMTTKINVVKKTKTTCD